MSKKQKEPESVKPLPARLLRLHSLRDAWQTAHSLEAQLRFNYSEACKQDPILALLLLSRLETTAKQKNKLAEIVSCLEVAS